MMLCAATGEVFGDHPTHGPEGVHFFTRAETIAGGWPTGICAGADCVMPAMG
jgi:malonate-semialdehyde dehydrogenase (acetylating)/methylmalonate-semialdehyde dehydrogenase